MGWYVTLRVFDVLGREVASLVGGVEELGYQSVHSSAKGGSASGGRLSSSVYFYQLKAGASVLVRRMLLLK